VLVGLEALLKQEKENRTRVPFWLVGSPKYFKENRMSNGTQ
jgi:hypothetical protein